MTYWGDHAPTLTREQSNRANTLREKGLATWTN